MKPFLKSTALVLFAILLSSSASKNLEFERVFTLSFNKLSKEHWTKFYKPDTLKTWKIENIWLQATNFSDNAGIDMEINGAVVSHSWVLKNDFPFWMGSTDSIRFRAAGSTQMSASITEFKITP